VLLHDKADTCVQIFVAVLQASACVSVRARRGRFYVLLHGKADSCVQIFATECPFRCARAQILIHVYTYNNTIQAHPLSRLHDNTHTHNSYTQSQATTHTKNKKNSQHTHTQLIHTNTCHHAYKKQKQIAAHTHTHTPALCPHHSWQSSC
jgi:hypothetical protein